MKIVGYVLAGLGLIGILVSSGKLHEAIPIIKTIATKYMIIGSAVILIAGIVFLMMDSKGNSKIQQVSEEVPIYEGEGKKRRIVGYKKAK